MDEKKKEIINKLTKNYQDSAHPSFLQTDSKKIYAELRDSIDYDISYTDIENFKNNTEEISRQRQLRLLRGAKRFGSYRQVKIMRREKNSFHSFVHSFIRSFVHLIVHSFIHIRSFMTVSNPNY